MKYVPLIEQLRQKQNKLDPLATETQKMAADIDYIAMMCDIDLDFSDAIEEDEEVINEEE